MSAQETLLNSTETYAVLDVKNSVELVEDMVKNALHQVSWPDLRCELFDVSHPVEYLPWAVSEAEYRERREGLVVVVSGGCGGGS